MRQRNRKREGERIKDRGRIAVAVSSSVSHFTLFAPLLCVSLSGREMLPVSSQTAGPVGRGLGEREPGAKYIQNPNQPSWLLHDKEKYLIIIGYGAINMLQINGLKVKIDMFIITVPILCLSVVKLKTAPVLWLWMHTALSHGSHFTSLWGSIRADLAVIIICKTLLIAAFSAKMSPSTCFRYAHCVHNEINIISPLIFIF